MKQRWSPRFAILLIAALMLGACSGTGAPEAQPTPFAPRTINAQIGVGTDTAAGNAFLPNTLKIRVGDTVQWKIGSDEPHTLTFLGKSELPAIAVPVPDSSEGDLMYNPQIIYPTRAPGAPIEVFNGDSLISSGLMANFPLAPDQPINDTISVTFSKAGFYKYICILHGLAMQADLIVEEATASDVPSQTDIDAMIKSEGDVVLARIEQARLQAANPLPEIGLNNSTIWHVKAGNIDFISTDERAQAYDFLPKDITVKVGDTVTWSSPGVHTISFIPAPPEPPIFLPRESPQGGPPQLIMNPQVFRQAKPAAIYDPTKYYNSADLGPYSPIGISWSLTFDKPGTYEYVCLLHSVIGMKGTVTVQ